MAKRQVGWGYTGVCSIYEAFHDKKERKKTNQTTIDPKYNRQLLPSKICGIHSFQIKQTKKQPKH